MSPVQTVTYVSGSDTRKTGAAEGTRTPDPIITNDVLYQLSYSGNLPEASRDAARNPDLCRVRRYLPELGARCKRLASGS